MFLENRSGGVYRTPPAGDNAQRKFGQAVFQAPLPKNFSAVSQNGSRGCHRTRAAQDGVRGRAQLKNMRSIALAAERFKPSVCKGDFAVRRHRKVGKDKRSVVAIGFSEAFHKINMASP